MKNRSRKSEENESPELQNGAQMEPKGSPKHDKNRSKIETKTRPIFYAKNEVFREVKSAPYIELSSFYWFWDVRRNDEK